MLNTSLVYIYVDPQIPKDIQNKAQYVLDVFLRQYGYELSFLNEVNPSKNILLSYTLNAGLSTAAKSEIQCFPEDWSKDAEFIWRDSRNEDVRDQLRMLFSFFSDELYYSLESLQSKNSPSLFIDKHGRLNIVEEQKKRPSDFLQAFEKKHFSLLSSKHVPPSILLTFDIDNLLVSWKGIAYRMLKGAKIRSISSYKKQKKVFIESTHKIIDQLETHNFKAVFFLKSLVGVPHQFDAKDYLFDKQTQVLLDRIIQHPLIECGYHSSYNASINPAIFGEELEQLENRLGKKIHVHRSHYLRYSYNSTFQALQKHAISVDSSIAWADVPVSRTGLFTDYPMFDLKEDNLFHIREVPLTFMDSQLCTGTSHSIVQIKEILEHQILRLRNRGRLISWDFHHLVYDQLLNPKNEVIFEHALKLIQKYSIQTIHSHETLS